MGTPSKNNCKTAAVMNLLGKGPAAGPVVTVQREQARDIEVITAEILEAKRIGGEAILTIGRGLIEAKALLSHGEWLPWLEDRVEFSEKTAQNLMRIARCYSNPQALADLGATKALMLAVFSEEDRNQFIAEPHLVNGEEKSVIDMTTRELDQAIKERDEALRAAELARAEQSAAEAAREKISQDMKFANQRIAGLDDLVQQKSAEAREAAEKLAQLSAELKELRERPVEVAVQADEAAVEAARKEVEARMQAEVDKARKAQVQAEKARKAAEDAKAEAQLEVVRANAKLEDARLQAEAARKKSAVAADPDLILFSELLDQLQTTLKRMGGVRLKKLAQNELETAQKLHAVIMGLVPVVKEAAGND